MGIKGKLLLNWEHITEYCCTLSNLIQHCEPTKLFKEPDVGVNLRYHRRLCELAMVIGLTLFG